MHRFCLGLLWQHGGNTVVKKTLLSSLPPSCSARPQITASSRRCPVDTWHPGEGRPAIPHLTGTHAYTHAHTPNGCLCACERVEYGAARAHTATLHGSLWMCRCAARCVCACELVLSVNLPLLPVCSGWFYWSNRQRGHTHTHTLAQARSSPDPRLIETDRDLVKLREQPGVVCRPGGIRPQVTEIVE